MTNSEALTQWTPPDRRSEKLQVLVTPSEKQQLMRLAQEDGRTLSNYLGQALAAHSMSP